MATAEQKRLLGEINTSLDKIKTNVPPSTAASVPNEVMENGVTPTELPVTDVDPSIANSALGAAQGFSAAQEAASAAAQTKADTQTSTVRALQEQVSGRGAERVEELEAAGIPESNKQLADMTSNIRLSSERLSQFDDSTFLGRETLRGEASARDITKNVFSAKDRERTLQRAIERTGKAAALRTQIATAELLQNNITAATAQIDAALEAEYGPKEESLKNEMFFLQRQWQVADKADQRAWQAKMNVVEQQQNEIKDAKDMVLNAMPYATPEELQSMNDPKLTPAQKTKAAQAVVARGLRQDRQAEISQRNINMAISNQKLSQLIAEANTPALGAIAAERMQADASAGSVRNFLSSILGSKDIPATVRTNVGTVFDVAGTLEQWAGANPEGEFAGMGAGAGVTGAVASPFVWALGSEATKAERTENRAMVEAVNLKVQQWASGAALTEQQTVQVGRLTPERGDTDKEVRRKMNSLYNFMMGVTETQLVTAGVNVPIPKVDLFELGDLLEQMSPEQRRQFEDELTVSQTTSPYGTY